LRATIDKTSIPLAGQWLHRIERLHVATEGEQPLRPLPPYKLDSAWTPAALYNGMIAPVGEYGIRGALWYQGESNAVRHQEYAQLLAAMIGAWREQFGVGDCPFYIVGLANFRNPTHDPNTPSDWAHLREAQRQVSLKVPNTAMSVTIDIGEAADIHPRNKQEVGRRLALIALAQTYGKQIVSRGPTLKSAQFKGNEVVLSFDHIGGGLTAMGDRLASFAVAGEDGMFAWAGARIEGDRVVVSSPDVPSPTAVRYAWADNPTASLYNREGLPAEPFEARK
jgi:sialate O-acetylesterase